MSRQIPNPAIAVDKPGLFFARISIPHELHGIIPVAELPSNCAFHARKAAAAQATGGGRRVAAAE
jgi:hypothetical protein